MAIRNPFTNKEQSETATILVVDDEVPVRTMMAKMLQRSGYTTLEAPGGKEALEICEQHIGIHLLITDLTMPGLNGFDLADQVGERWPELKILFMSGDANGYGLRRRIAERPFLGKPFTADELREKVRELVGNGAPSSGYLSAP